MLRFLVLPETGRRARRPQLRGGLADDEREPPPRGRGEDGDAVAVTVVAHCDDEAGEPRVEQRVSDAADIEPDLDLGGPGWCLKSQLIQAEAGGGAHAPQV